MQRYEPVNHSKKRPLLLPKDDHSTIANSSTIGQAGLNNSGSFSRRSKHGCWTCRERKVKCDEGRPICVRCIRLNLSCDYSIRLSFRDDTKRIHSLMALEVNLDGNPIWNLNSPTIKDESLSHNADELGAFSTLTTDEDRERKAETAHPGEYVVIVNPDSFLHLPQYTADPEKKTLVKQYRSRSASLADVMKKVSIAPIPYDPNIILLREFEDNNQRIRKKGSSLLSPTTSKIRLEDTSMPKETEQEISLPLQTVAERNDIIYVQQFRNIIWKQLVQGEVEMIETTAFTSSDISIVEQAATDFPPLLHAIMAIGALGLSQEDSKDPMDALHHYNQSISTLQIQLQNPQAFSTDGIFLTYFLLLLYEIAAGESRQSEIWFYYLFILLHISKLRHETCGERYPFITWWICNIDLYALLSGVSSGDFISTVLCEEMVAVPGSQLFPLVSDGSSIIYVDEAPTLPQMLQLNYKVTLLAVQIGLLARELRQDVQMANEVESTERHCYIKLRQSRVFDLQESLRSLCVTILPIGQQADSLPLRVQQLFYHASSLCWACLIYSHTSMWPGQWFETGAEFNAEIANAASEILLTAQKIIKAGWLKLRFIMIPIFMAGYASTDGNQKMIAVDLLKSLEKESIWGGTTVTRRALEAVYERQSTRFLLSGQDRDVGWMEVLAEQGLEVINFGL